MKGPRQLWIKTLKGENRVHVTQENFEMAVAKIMQEDLEKICPALPVPKSSGSILGLLLGCEGLFPGLLPRFPPLTTLSSLSLTSPVSDTISSLYSLTSWILLAPLLPTTFQASPLSISSRASSKFFEAASFLMSTSSLRCNLVKSDTTVTLLHSSCGNC